MSESAVVATTQTIHAHRALADEGVQQFYACEGLSPPLTLWLRSPAEGAIVADILANVQSHGPQARNNCLWDVVGMPREVWLPEIDEQLLNDVRAQIWNRAWDKTAKEIGHQFHVNVESQKIQWGHLLDLYPVFHHTVGHVNSMNLHEALRLSPAKALSNLEKISLAEEKYSIRRATDDRYYQYNRGETGRVITTYLEACGYGMVNSTRPPLMNPEQIESPERARSLYQIAKHCGWFWMFEGVCVLTDPPEFVRVDDAGRMHCENGPALRYADGLEIYAWHGVNVPPAVITHPAQITPNMIKDERNSEVRRVMIELFGGLARYAMDGDWTVVNEIAADHPRIGLRTAKLWRGDEEDDHDEYGHPLPSMYLDLLNSTPEPDGTTKRYMLRVDPAAYDGDAARYVQAAAASTWRNADGTLTYPDWRDYAPVAES